MDQQFDRNYLWATLQAIDAATLVITTDGQRALFNQRLCELFGYPPEQLASLSVSDLVARLRERLAASETLLERALAALTDPTFTDKDETELTYPQRRTLRCWTGPVPDSQQRLLGRIVTWRDVTREARINRMKTEFVSNVSHELRTPLAAIKGFISAIIEDWDTMEEEIRRNFLNIVKDETDRLSRLIDDLLDLSRIESGRWRKTEQYVHLLELLKDVTISMRVQAEEKQVRLLTEFPERDVVLIGDRDQLAQVVLNLLSNAIRFTPSGGRVTVRLKEQGELMVIEVEDTGIGIAPEHLPHIFEKFYRVRQPGEGMNGTGLGLSIAKELVEEHGGELHVRSEVGRGSCFRVVFCQPSGETSI